MAKATVLLGAALLSAIGAGTVTHISKAQAESLDASHFTVNTADLKDGNAAVTLTDAGKAALAGAPAAAAPAAEPSITIATNIPMPTGAARTRETTYPFDKLEVGHSFHVPKTAENPEPHIRLSSSVSGVRVRYSEVLKDAAGNVLTESYQSPIYAKDANGDYVKGADGKRVKTGEETKTREQRSEPTRDFMVKAVDASDPAGEGARCWRTK